MTFRTSPGWTRSHRPISGARWFFVSGRRGKRAFAMSDHYWREVFAGAWGTTWRVLGWSKEKIAGAVAALIGTIIVGGAAAGFNLVNSAISATVGVAVVAACVFVWGFFKTTAQMYRAAQVEKKQMNETGTGKRKRPRADFDKWRHVPKLELQQAAQLWSGEQPGLGMYGEVAETYAMLCGAIQTGDLEIGFNQTVEPRMRGIVHQREMENPRPDMKVTREALRAFAKRHGYDPEFLRDH